MKVGSPKGDREYRNSSAGVKSMLWSHSLEGTEEFKLKPEVEGKPHWKLTGIENPTTSFQTTNPGRLCHPGTACLALVRIKWIWK